MHSSKSASNNRAGRPAVSTDGLDDHGVSPWLDQFFGNCSLVGCNRSKIAFIAFHDYQGDVSKILSRAEGLLRRYGKPTWITEFAINKWARVTKGPGGGCNECNITRAMQDDYMRQVLPALEKSEAVHRYAWYSARDRPQPQINMVRFPAPSLGHLLRAFLLARPLHLASSLWCGAGESAGVERLGAHADEHRRALQGARRRHPACRRALIVLANAPIGFVPGAHIQ